MKKGLKHYEESLVIPAKAEDLFSFMDDHRNLSSHMNKLSWIMGGEEKWKLGLIKEKAKK